MRKSQHIIRPLVACICISAAIAWAAPQDVFAWLEDQNQDAFIQVVRNGAVIPYDRGVGLQPCDSVSFSPAAPPGATTVAISTADGSRLLIERYQKPVTIRCTSPVGLTREVAAFVQALIGKSNQRMSQIVGTRGGADCHDHSDLDVPLLSKANVPTMLVAGRPGIALTLVGSHIPFDVELASPAGAVVAHETLVQQHFLRISAQAIRPGRYQLRVRDSCGGGIEDDDFNVVSADQRPAIPELLANLPDPGRTIFYADYLIALNDGRWGLEALQLVAALPRDNPAVAGWLEQWGGGSNGI